MIFSLAFFASGIIFYLTCVQIFLCEQVLNKTDIGCTSITEKCLPTPAETKIRRTSAQKSDSADNMSRSKKSCVNDVSYPIEDRSSETDLPRRSTNTNGKKEQKFLPKFKQPEWFRSKRYQQSPQRPSESDDPEEREERINRNFARLMQIMTFLGHVDNYLTDKGSFFVKLMSQAMNTEDEPENVYGKSRCQQK